MNPEKPDWPSLLQPLAKASSALGRLGLALEGTALHKAWLWRETARSAAHIAQVSGHRVRLDRLMQSLSGIPVNIAEDDTGLAAARRTFLASMPLFLETGQADSLGENRALIAPLWTDDAPGAAQSEGQGREDDERKRLLDLVHDLTRKAGQEGRPALLDLLRGLRHHARVRGLPSNLVRLALPLALHRSGLVPKTAPALLGGRLPLGMTRAADQAPAITPWLARTLFALGDEATRACKRLTELERQHRVWHTRLTGAGLRRHARTPKVLDLLATTPVLSASLTARHLGCSPQAAGAILHHLTDLGIVTEATVRSRWKIYLAGDLALPDRDHTNEPPQLAFSDPVPEIGRDAIDTTLDALFADLERLERRARSMLSDVSLWPGETTL